MTKLISLSPNKCAAIDPNEIASFVLVDPDANAKCIRATMKNGDEIFFNREYGISTFLTYEKMLKMINDAREEKLENIC